MRSKLTLRHSNRRLCENSRVTLRRVSEKKYVSLFCLVIYYFVIIIIINEWLFICLIDKKPSGKSKDEQMAERKQELEKRLQDVTGQLGNVKKATKKGKIKLIKL